MLEEIIGAKSKLKIIEVMLNSNEGLSINAVSVMSGISYSVAHRDIGILKSTGFVGEYDGKYSVNQDNELYEKVRGLFFESRSFGNRDKTINVSISNRQKKDIAKIIEEVKKHKKAQIVVHHNADPDALGSAIALAYMLKHMGVKAMVSAPLGISAQGRQVIEKFKFSVEETVMADATIVFIMDSSSVEQIGELKFDYKPVFVLIDHHQRGSISERADIGYVDTEAHSTAILVFRMIVFSRADVMCGVAPFLLCGIVADTAFLRLADKNDIEAVNFLLNFVGLDEIFDVLSVKEDISERIAKLKVLRRSEIYRIRNLIIAFSQSGSFESRAAANLVKTGADVAFVFNVKKDEIRISGRMRKYLGDNIDLVKILKKGEKLIDGSVGGHAEAASANGKNVKCAGKVRNIIVAEFEKRASSKAKIIK